MNPLRSIFLSLLLLATGIYAENPHGVEVIPEEGELFGLRDFILSFPEIVEYMGDDGNFPFLECPDGEKIKLSVDFEGMAYECCRLYLPEDIDKPGSYKLVLPDGTFRVGMDWLIMTTEFDYTLIPSEKDPEASVDEIVSLDESDIPLYNLQGRRAISGERGIVITAGGRKIIRYRP